MELTIDELDSITEIQFNVPDAEIEAAIAELRPEALLTLRRECLATAAKQSNLAARVKRHMQARGLLP
jgi:hypothetical protein